MLRIIIAGDSTHTHQVASTSITRGHATSPSGKAGGRMPLPAYREGRGALSDLSSTKSACGPGTNDHTGIGATSSPTSGRNVTGLGSGAEHEDTTEGREASSIQFTSRNFFGTSRSSIPDGAASIVDAVPSSPIENDADARMGDASTAVSAPPSAISTIMNRSTPWQPMTSPCRSMSLATEHDLTSQQQVNNPVDASSEHDTTRKSQRAATRVTRWLPRGNEEGRELSGGSVRERSPKSTPAKRCQDERLGSNGEQAKCGEISGSGYKLRAIEVNAKAA